MLGFTSIKMNYCEPTVDLLSIQMCGIFVSLLIQDDDYEEEFKLPGVNLLGWHALPPMTMAPQGLVVHYACINNLKDLWTTPI